MAGLIGLTASDIDVQDATGAIRWKYDGEWIPHPAVRLTTTLPAAVTAEDGVREMQRVRWGFPVGPRPVGNARDDKLQTSPMWSKMLGTSYALFVSTGIYEMTRDDAGNKQAYWFRRRDQKPIVMPGLVGARNLKGEDAFALVTITPNQFVGTFHDRMIGQLQDDQLDVWLRLEARPVAALRDCLAAPPDDELVAYPLKHDVGKAKFDNAEALDPVGEPVTWSHLQNQ